MTCLVHECAQLLPTTDPKARSATSRPIRMPRDRPIPCDGHTASYDELFKRHNSHSSSHIEPEGHYEGMVSPTPMPPCRDEDEAMPRCSMRWRCRGGRRELGNCPW